MTFKVKSLDNKEMVTSHFDGVEDDQISVIKVITEWCGSCKGFTPKYEKLAKDLGDKIQFLEADAEQCPRLSMEHDIRSVPTLLVFKGKDRIIKYSNPTKDYAQITTKLTELHSEQG